MNTIDFRSRHGAWETNGLIDPQGAVDAVNRTRTYALSDPAVVRINRLRLISDPQFPLWDVSYCWGELADGTVIPVQLDRHQFPKSQLSRALVDLAKDAGRYAKGIGLLDAVSLCQ